MDLTFIIIVISMFIAYEIQSFSRFELILIFQRTSKERNISWKNVLLKKNYGTHR